MQDSAASSGEIADCNQLNTPRLTFLHESALGYCRGAARRTPPFKSSPSVDIKASLQGEKKTTLEFSKNIQIEIHY